MSSAGQGSKSVLILGCGFFGQVLAQRLAFRGIPVIGTARAEPQLGIIRTRGAESLRFDENEGSAVIARLAGRVRAVVMSIPPDTDGADRKSTRLNSSHT